MVREPVEAVIGRVERGVTTVADAEVVRALVVELEFWRDEAERVGDELEALTTGVDKMCGGEVIK